MSKGIRILIVEDEEIILADVERQLRKHGYAIAGTASSGADAVREASSRDPDLILMDVRLQGTMSGVEAAREIRRISRAPILFVSAHANTLAAQLPELAGHNGVLVKPFSPTQLCEAIESMLS